MPGVREGRSFRRGSGRKVEVFTGVSFERGELVKSNVSALLGEEAVESLVLGNNIEGSVIEEPDGSEGSA